MSIRQRFHNFWTGCVIAWCMTMVVVHRAQRRRARRQYRREMSRWA